MEHPRPRGARFAFLLAAPILAAGLVGCGVLDSGPPAVHRLDVALPEPPASWACLPDLRFELRWRDAAGLERSSDASPGSRVQIEVKRGRPQAILALPAPCSRGMEPMEPMEPAGALYPEALEATDSDALSLDWPGGYAASIALDLESAGLDPWAYDLSRLAAEGLARSGDPWLLPALEAARRLAEGSFRADAFRERSRSAVVLPGPGPWAPESPFAAAPLGSGEGPLAMLPEGLSRFVGPAGELLVSVDAEGNATCLIRSAVLPAAPLQAIPKSARGSAYRVRRRSRRSPAAGLFFSRSAARAAPPGYSRTLHTRA